MSLTACHHSPQGAGPGLHPLGNLSFPSEPLKHASGSRGPPLGSMIASMITRKTQRAVLTAKTCQATRQSKSAEGGRTAGAVNQGRHQGPARRATQDVLSAHC